MTLTAETSADATAIRPFHVDIPEEAWTTSVARIAATRWPEKETVDDPSQGVQLATMQALARYWGTEYDFGASRGEAERPAAVHDRDRRARHPLHPRHVRSTRTRCRSSSRTAGPARSSRC